MSQSIKNIVQNVELFIVPGVAFTQTGFRLGRGEGYYDKLLQKYPKAIKIGICHDFQILNDLPIEDRDVAMDYVFTNKKLLQIINIVILSYGIKY